VGFSPLRRDRAGRGAGDRVFFKLLIPTLLINWGN
jgi:hypothetical protein